MNRISISDLSLARSVYASGNTIKAIKMIRDITGCTLKEAKALASGVNEVEQEQQETSLDRLSAAQARITALENVFRAAEKELRIASKLPDLSPRNKVEFSNAANMLLAVLQDIP